jgi:D-amino-acid oxidase
MPKNVCVIGAGVSGLTSAICLAEKHTVTIVAKEHGQETTSSVAAAFWYPFWVGQEPVHDWYDPEWAANTYRKLETLPRTAETGISKVRLNEYFERRMTDKEIQDVIDGMWWQEDKWHLPGLGFEDMSADQVSLRRVKKLKFKRGIYFNTFVVNMKDYLSYLRREAERLRVKFEKPRSVNHSSELLAKYDVVVNCSGIGARALVDEDRPGGPHRLRASEGVVLQLTPLQEVRDIFLIHTGAFELPIEPAREDYFGRSPLYIVPRSGTSPDIILGGSTTDEGEFDEPERKSWKVQHLPWDDIPTDHWIRRYTNRIYRDCCQFEKSLAGATVLEAHVGYRPVPKPKVRLEREGDIIHNYGHGGAGITLSWGCAERVALLIEQNRIPAAGSHVI